MAELVCLIFDGKTTTRWGRLRLRSEGDQRAVRRRRRRVECAREDLPLGSAGEDVGRVSVSVTAQAQHHTLSFARLNGHQTHMCHRVSGNLAPRGVPVGTRAPVKQGFFYFWMTVVVGAWWSGKGSAWSPAFTKIRLQPRLARGRGSARGRSGVPSLGCYGSPGSPCGASRDDATWMPLPAGM